MLKILLEKLGHSVLNTLAGFGSFCLFTGRSFYWIFVPPFDFKSFILQFYLIGVRSIPVAIISAFFIGMVLALQLGGPLERQMQGIIVFMGGGVALAMTRELVPVIISILLAGRVGSSIAAEIGTMKVTEQVDALVTLATDPIHYLCVPRLLASIISFPLITILSIQSGILGGACISKLSLDIPFSIFYANVQLVLKVGDVVSGVVKTVFFGAEIALISCFMGFQTVGGAGGVGLFTVRAVVTSFMVIIVTDYLFAYVFQLFGV